MESLPPVHFVALALFVTYLTFSLVGDMATARGHSPWPWWAISLLLSPFGSMLLLWVFFDVEDEEQES